VSTDDGANAQDSSAEVQRNVHSPLLSRKWPADTAPAANDVRSSLIGRRPGHGPAAAASGAVRSVACRHQLGAERILGYAVMLGDRQGKRPLATDGMGANAPTSRNDLSLRSSGELTSVRHHVDDGRPALTIRNTEALPDQQ